MVSWIGTQQITGIGLTGRAIILTPPAPVIYLIAMALHLTRRCLAKRCFGKKILTQLMVKRSVEPKIGSLTVLNSTRIQTVGVGIHMHPSPKMTSIMPGSILLWTPSITVVFIQDFTGGQ